MPLPVPRRFLQFALWGWMTWGLAMMVLGIPIAAAGDGEGPGVKRVELRLTIYRGGERTPDGRRVGFRGARVAGVARYHLAAPARPGDTLTLLDFAHHLPQEPDGLDAVTADAYFDGPFEPGRLQVDDVFGAETMERVGARQDLVLQLQPGRTEVVIRYEVRVPHRYWPFGCIRDRCSLSGGLAPLPSASARGGLWLPSGGRVVAPVQWDLESVRFGSVPSWVPGTVPTELQRKVLDGARILIADGGGPKAYPSIFWGPGWNLVRKYHRGVDVRVHHLLPRPPGRIPHERTIQLYRDVPGRLRRIATEVIELADVVGLPLAVDSDLMVVQGPLRSQLAEFHPGVVVVSDQIYEILPAKRFLRFHELAVARAMLDEVFYRKFVGTHDPSTDVWLPGMLAFSLVGAWEQSRDHPDEYAWDILRNLTFVPAVDRFLYTGQASFSDAYFRGSEDPMPLRNHPLWFSHGLPTGRRIHEKLEDTLSPKQLARAYAELMRDPGADPRAAVEHAYGHRMGWFFDQWLGPYPSVDYAISAVESEPIAGGFRHHIAIEKKGRQPVIEPVQVLVIEEDGDEHHLIWNGESAEENQRLVDEPIRGHHRWVLQTDTELQSVEIDPRNRLVETPQPPRRNVDPRFNNRKPPQPRFLYTGAGLNVGASEFLKASTPQARFAAIGAYVFFEGSLRRDLRRTGHLQLYHDRETWGGAAGGANLWFGGKINRQRRRARISMFQTVEWLNGLGLDPVGGLRLIESLTLIDDTRSFFMWPQRGHRLLAGISARQTVRLDGREDHRLDLLARAAWVQLWPLAHDHILASEISMGLVIPLVRQPEFRNLLRAGGIGALSGYIGDEIFGLASAIAQLEYRHRYLSNLPVNLGHFAWLREIGGVLFAGTATMSDCDTYAGWFGEDSWYGQVGYGLTAYTQIFGVSPQFFRLDVAVPLIRRQTTCLGRQLPSYLAEVQGLASPDSLLPEFNVNITFVQPF